MSRRTSLDIKKEIIKVLKSYGEMSLRELDIKVNTNYKTIREQLMELEYFGKVMLIKHNKHKVNGRPYTSVKLKNN